MKVKYIAECSLGLLFEWPLKTFLLSNGRQSEWCPSLLPYKWITRTELTVLESIEHTTSQMKSMRKKTMAKEEMNEKS